MFIVNHNVDSVRRCEQVKRNKFVTSPTRCSTHNLHGCLSRSSRGQELFLVRQPCLALAVSVSLHTPGNGGRLWMIKKTALRTGTGWLFFTSSPQLSVCIAGCRGVV